ncbi:MAG: hypothetical protein HQL01_14090 [Nitrospirae bacterium]|nr:hypothetical protein [Nitrospirota bacterium]
MNINAEWPHIHLLVNHIPIMWTVFAFILYYYGTIKKNGDIQKAALLGFVATASMAWFVFRSGDNAALYMPGLPLVSLDYLYEHEQWAEKAMWALYAAGAVACIGVVKLWLRRQLHGLFFIFFSITAIVGISLSGITSNLGVKIIHPEIRPGSTLIQSPKYHEYRENRKKGGIPKSDKTTVNNAATIKPTTTVKPPPNTPNNIPAAAPSDNSTKVPTADTVAH